MYRLQGLPPVPADSFCIQLVSSRQRPENLVQKFTGKVNCHSDCCKPGARPKSVMLPSPNFQGTSSPEHFWSWLATLCLSWRPARTRCAGSPCAGRWRGKHASLVCNWSEASSCTCSFPAGWPSFHHSLIWRDGSGLDIHVIGTATTVRCMIFCSETKSYLGICFRLSAAACL